MSIQAVNWALGVHVGSPTLKAVLVAVANYADQDGCCWPSQEKLAEITELSVRAVRGALAALEEKRFLVRFARPRRENMTHQSDMIRLAFRESEPKAPKRPRTRKEPEGHRQEVPVDPLPASGAETHRQEVPKPPAPRAAYPSGEPSKDPSGRARVRATRAELPSDFGLTIPRAEVARQEGLSRARAEREIKIFRNHYRADARLCADWDALWQNWCIRAADLTGRDVPPPVALAPMVKVLEASKEGQAWKAHLLARGERGLFFERDSTGCEPARSFPTRWPPGHPSYVANPASEAAYHEGIARARGKVAA